MNTLLLVKYYANINKYTQVKANKQNAKSFSNISGALAQNLEKMLLTPQHSVESNIFETYQYKVFLLIKLANLFIKVPSLSTHVRWIYLGVLNKVRRPTGKRHKTNFNVRDIKTLLKTFGYT